MSQSTLSLAQKQTPPLIAALLQSAYWMFLGILVILPVDGYLTLPGKSSGVFLSQMSTVEVCLVLFAYFVIPRFIKQRPLPLMEWKTVIPLAVLFLVALIASVQAFSPGTAFREALKIPVYLGIFVLGSVMRTLPNARRHALIALLIGLGIVFVVALANATGKIPDYLGVILNIQHAPATLPFSSTVRLESTFRYPNELASYLLIVLPIFLAHMMKSTDRRMQVLLGSANLAGLWMLIFTYTRGALIAGIIIALVMFAILGGWRIAAYAIIGLSLLSLAVTVRGGVLAARLLSVFSGTDTAYQSRDVIRQWAWDTFLHHPLFGIGLSNLKLLPNAPYLVPALGQHATDAENMYLNILAELGAIGFVVFIILLYCVVIRLWRGMQQSPLEISTWNIGAFGALAALTIYGLADPIVVSGQVMGMLAAVIGLAGSIDAQAIARLLRNSRPSISDEQTVLLPTVTDRRIVFLVNAPGFGGAQQHSLNLADALQKQGARVLIVAPPRSPTLLRAESLHLPWRAMTLGTNIGRGKGILGTLAFMNPVGRAATARQVVEMDEEQPSIFICPFPREQILTASLSSQGVRSIWVVHAPFHYPVHRLFVLHMWLQASRHVSAVVAVSTRLGAQLKRLGMAANQLRVIPNAITVPEIEALDESDRMAYLIGTASRLVQAKGIQYLIAAMPRIVQRHPHAHLQIAGTGNYERQLRKQVRRLALQDHVEFLGHLDDPVPFLARLHVFVHPSVDEVLPTVILEAAGAGTPVVASNLADIPDEVHDGLTGWLTSPGDSAAIAEAVNRLLDDPAKARAMGAAGRDLVQRDFPIQRSATTFMQMCHDLSTEGEFDDAISWKATIPSAVIRRKALLGRSSIVLISKLVTALATACWTILAARTLLPADFGNLALAAGLVDLGTSLSDIGVTAVATRDLATLPEPAMRRLLGTVMYAKLLVGLIGIGTVLAITAILPFHAGTFRIILVMAPSLLFAAFYSMTLVFRARAMFAYLLIVSLVVSVIGISLACVAAFFDGSVIAFAGVETGTQICAGLLACIICVAIFHPDLRPRWADVQKLFMIAMPLGIATAMSILYYRIDVPLLGLLSTSEELAKYSSAYRFLDVLTLLPASLAAVTLPQMAIMFRRNISELRDYAQQYLDIAASIGLFVALLLSYSARPVLDLLYAGRYDAASSTLQVLAWAGTATFITNVFSPLTIALNKPRSFLMVTAIGLCVNVGLNILLIPRFGSLAAAYATLATEGVVIICLAMLTVRALRWHINLLTLAGVSLVTLLAALITELPIFQNVPWIVGVLLLSLLWLVLVTPFLLAKRKSFSAIFTR